MIGERFLRDLHVALYDIYCIISHSSSLIGLAGFQTNESSGDGVSPYISCVGVVNLSNFFSRGEKYRISLINDRLSKQSWHKLLKKKVCRVPSSLFASIFVLGQKSQPWTSSLQTDKMIERSERNLHQYPPTAYFTCAMWTYEFINCSING